MVSRAGQRGRNGRAAGTDTGAFRTVKASGPGHREALVRNELGDPLIAAGPGSPLEHVLISLPVDN